MWPCTVSCLLQSWCVWTDKMKERVSMRLNGTNSAVTCKLFNMASKCNKLVKTANLLLSAHTKTRSYILQSCQNLIGLKLIQKKHQAVLFLYRNIIRTHQFQSADQSLNHTEMSQTSCTDWRRLARIDYTTLLTCLRLWIRQKSFANSQQSVSDCS